jgi:hypothetical protein
VGVDSSLPLLTKEVSLRYIDLVGEVFQILKDAGGRALSMDEVKRLGSESLKGYSEDDIEQALQDLAVRRLAKKWDTHRYQITDPGQKTTEADVMCDMLDRPYNKQKEALEFYLHTRRNERITSFGFVFLLVFGLVFLLFLPHYLPTTIGPIALSLAMLLILVYLLAFGRYFSRRSWKKYELSMEGALAVRLLDSYSDYRPFITEKQTASLVKVFVPCSDGLGL